MPSSRVIAVDAMSGDNGPRPVLRGLAAASRKAPEIRFILTGPEARLRKMMARRRHLAERCEIRDAPEVVEMTESLASALRRRESTSMWRAIRCVRDGEASVALSCGNTGALGAMAVSALKTIPGVDRPAIAALWPTRRRGRFNVMLDMGAHHSATAEELRAYAIIGAEYARLGLDVARPRVALLNIGEERSKGHPDVRVAGDLIAEFAASADAPFEYVGFVEGDSITSDIADVIVTDGFTGNVALKTAEGIARFIRDVITTTMRRNLLNRAVALLAYPTLRSLRDRMDPRRMNGGVLLGLNGVVVKSHGRSDARGIEAAVGLAARVVERDLPLAISRELARRMAPAAASS